MKDIIFKAMNHNEIKWNVSKNIMYKEEKKLKELSQREKDKDKYYFFNDIFPDEICKIIMKFKEKDENKYFQELFKNHSLKADYIKDYILSKSKGDLNDDIKLKIIKKRMTYDELGDIFYYNMLNKPHPKSYEILEYYKKSITAGSYLHYEKKYIHRPLNLKIDELFKYHKERTVEINIQRDKERKRLNDLFLPLDKLRNRGFLIISVKMDKDMPDLWQQFIVLDNAHEYKEMNVREIMTPNEENKPFDNTCFEDLSEGHFDKNEGLFDIQTRSCLDSRLCWLYKRQIISKFRNSREIRILENPKFVGHFQHEESHDISMDIVVFRRVE